jgi:hypothetical protein
MFTYLDPTVRRKLIAQGNSTHRSAWRAIEHARRGERAINRSGPIRCRSISAASTKVQWYASVGFTELTKVEDLAGALRTQGGGKLFRCSPLQWR